MLSKKAKVIMLPAKTPEHNPSGIMKCPDGLRYIQKGKGVLLNKIGSYTPQHLYITTDDEIKDGDWKIVNLHTIKQHKKGDFLPKFGSLHKKIIATTDKSLRIGNCNNCTTDKDYRHNFSTCKCKLPQPSQTFIKKYCELGGIGEVLVEYHEKCIIICREKTATKCKDTLCQHIILKVDSHNTITIHSIKDSWSREEVEELCRSAHKNGWASNNMFTEKHGLNPKYSIDNWIKENL